MMDAVYAVLGVIFAVIAGIYHILDAIGDWVNGWQVNTKIVVAVWVSFTWLAIMMGSEIDKLKKEIENMRR